MDSMVVHWRSFVAAGAIGLLFLLSSPSASAIGSIPNAVTSPELADVIVLEQMKLDVSEIRHSMSNAGSLQLEILGSMYSFDVRPADMGVVEDMTSDPAMSCLARTDFFEGMTSDGQGSLRATLTPDWLHIGLVINGRDFFVDPTDCTGESGYYAVYSSESARINSIDLANDVQDLPDDLAGATPVSPKVSILQDYSLEEGMTVAAQVDSATESSAATVAAAADSASKNKTCDPAGGDPEYRLARIITACDIEYRNLYPSDWASRMTARLNDICGKYESQASISFRLSINPWAIPSGQCTSTDADTLLSQFRTYMRTDSGVSGVARDVSHLFSGKDLNGNVGGRSWEPGVGSQKWGLGDLAYSLSEQWHDSSQNTFLMGHELGHNFNGDHAYWTWIGLYQSWMCPTYGGPMIAQFSTNNANRVRSWAQQALDLQKSTNPGPSSISGDGLQSSNFAHEGPFIYFVANQMTVTYDIKNTGSQGITLDWLFVGARDASGANRDFGHIYNMWIGAGQTHKYTGSYTPSSGGTWTLWPAYKIGSHYGPNMWITITPTMYYDKAHWIGVDAYTSAHNVDLFYRFYVLTTVSTPTVGSTVTVSVSMYNGQAGTGTTSFNFLFVGCHNALQQNKDFGYSSQLSMTQLASSSATGGGWLVFASRTLDTSGSWSFWPAYNIGGSYGPYEWHALSLSV